MIVTPDQRLRVFISSTLDLREERAAARRAVETLNLTPVMFEAGARPDPPRALYTAYVRQSDVFVAIYARRYGWTAPGMEVSGLEDEFILSTGMPRLVYIQADVDREPQLHAFLERVRDGGLSYTPFRTAADLEDLLKNDLVVLITERFHASDDAVAADRRTPSAPLPVPATPFVGRDADVAEIAARLRDDVRLVTLVGPGGIGKTRLAIEAARRLEPEFPGGTFYVSLVALREPDLVADTIAATLDVTTTDASRAVAALADAIGDRRTLLILDNFEQVVPGATVVAELIGACAQLTVIVTSRIALRLGGEREFPVQPLAVPTARVPSERLRGYAAVQLFVEAARAVRSDFDLDERSTAAVVDICRELDGLPLALELAAAMVRIMTPETARPASGPAPGSARRPARHACATPEPRCHDRLELRPAGRAHQGRVHTAERVPWWVHAGNDRAGV